MVVYAPGTQETDPKKQNRAIQAHASAIAAISASYVSSFNARTGAVVPAQGDYPTSLIPGTTTNDNAAAGNIGEYIEGVVPAGSAVSLVSSTAKTVTSIPLGAGDWDVDGVVYYVNSATTSVTASIAYLSLITNTSDTTTGRFGQSLKVPTVFGVNGAVDSVNIQPYRFPLSGSASIFLVALGIFTASTYSAFGIIRARRVR